MLVLGIDIGTSGVRTAVLNAAGEPIASLARASHEADAGSNANAWWQAVQQAVRDQITLVKQAGYDPREISGLAVDGTSGSMVLADADLKPVTPALLYNTAGFIAEAQRIAAFAPDPSITRGQSSALARMLHLQALDQESKAVHLLHQADFIVAKFAGQSLGSDDNNALKTGWDPEARSWPDWLSAAGVNTALLPKVSLVGEVIGKIEPAIADQFDLSSTLGLHAGTTDSIAAFLASGANQVGDAVTSLGTTLAIKLLSDTRVDDPASGVYSHRLGDNWLAGGASNTGGGVLAHFFSTDQLKDLSRLINPKIPSELCYYPLLKPGERFPINDPHLQPRLEPRPTDDALFLHGLLESMARIEETAYARLQALGAPRPARLFTAGGGAKNDIWTAIRARRIASKFKVPHHAEAAVGVARLCLDG
ncbi:MAG: FGGY-family carbohydrate kinase [Pseudomonadota bacterium]